MSEFIFTYTTMANLEEAKKLGLILLKEKLAACVNIIPNIISLYEWKGEIQQDQEVIILIKSLDHKFLAISNKIKEIHSYDIPAIIKIDCSDIDNAFSQWIRNQLN